MVATCNLHVNEGLYLPSVLTMACIRNIIFLVRQTTLDLYITKTWYIMGALITSLYVTLETLLQLFMKTSSSQKNVGRGKKTQSIYNCIDQSICRIGRGDAEMTDHSASTNLSKTPDMREARIQTLLWPHSESEWNNRIGQVSLYYTVINTRLK